MSEAATIIEEFKRLLLQEVTITLTNMYKEVPIVHPASICDVRGGEMIVETNELQISAMHWSGSTIIQARALNAPVEGEVSRTDIRRNQVTLCSFHSTELPAEQRATVRVRLKKPLRITLTSPAGTVTPGVIHDVSLGGCRASTGHNAPEGAEITVELTLEGQKLLVPARLLRVEGEAPHFHCTLLFEHTQETEQYLSVYIHKRELEIIKELQNTL